MSQQIDGNTKSFTCGGAISQFARVTLSSGKLAAAGATDKDIGTLLEQSFADGDVRTVLLRTAAGTCKCIAASAITAGSAISTAASGKINDTAATGSFIFGTALEAASGDGSVIECLRNAHGDTAAS